MKVKPKFVNLEEYKVMQLMGMFTCTPYYFYKTDAPPRARCTKANTHGKPCSQYSSGSYVVPPSGAFNFYWVEDGD